MLTTSYLVLRYASRPVRSSHRSPRRGRGDRGEGVISAAIAVLVMAFLGVAMWVGLKGIWDTAEDNTADQVGEIGE
jgi:hypothetical protein